MGQCCPSWATPTSVTPVHLFCQIFAILGQGCAAGRQREPHPPGVVLGLAHAAVRGVGGVHEGRREVLAREDAAQHFLVVGVTVLLLLNVVAVGTTALILLLPRSAGIVFARFRLLQRVLEPLSGISEVGDGPFHRFEIHGSDDLAHLLGVPSRQRAVVAWSAPAAELPDATRPGRRIPGTVSHGKIRARLGVHDLPVLMDRVHIVPISIVVSVPKVVARWPS